MSYKAFLNDLNSLVIEFKASGKTAPTDYDDLLAIIRDRWMVSSRFEALVDFVLENWNEGNCDKFIAPLEPVLLEHHSDLYKKLWNGIINSRIRILKNWISKHALETVDLKDINGKDTSSFVATSQGSYSDPVLVAAYYRTFTLQGISNFHSGLSQLKDSKELQRLAAVREDLARLLKQS